MDCEFKNGEICQVASDLAGIPAEVKPGFCEKCLGCDKPKQPNHHTASLAIHALNIAGKLDLRNQRHITDHMDRTVRECKDGNCSGPQMGPGTELKELIPSLFKKEGCGCNSYAAQMDRWGVQGCTERFEEILDHLVGKARGWAVPAFASRPIARKWIQTAIDNASQPWPFLWTYWAGGAKGDELRYSVRSVLKHMPDATVVIVGDKPDWYDGEFIHSPRIPATDFHAFKDCYTKLLRACRQYGRFIWMMDDVYWIKQFTMSEACAPKYVRHVSQQRFYEWKPKNTWAKTRARAYSYLIDSGKPTYDFAAHLPQPIRSKTFLEMEEKLGILEDYKNWECVYFNSYYSHLARDYGKKFHRVTKQVSEIKTPHKILNHIDSQYSGAVERFLKQCFPDRCAVEK